MTRLTTNAAAFIDGYRDGIEGHYRNAERGTAEPYNRGYDEGAETRRLIEEEAGELIEQRIRGSMRRLHSAMRRAHEEATR